MAQRLWQDLSRGERIATLILASAEVAMTTMAVVDLARRPGNRVRGPKAVWWPVLLVQPIGPVLYLAWGRRRSAGGASPRS